MRLGFGWARLASKWTNQRKVVADLPLGPEHDARRGDPSCSSRKGTTCSGKARMGWMTHGECVAEQRNEA